MYFRGFCVHSYNTPPVLSQTSSTAVSHSGGNCNLVNKLCFFLLLELPNIGRARGIAGGPNWCIYHLLGSQGFQNGRIHWECMNKTKLSFIPLFLMHCSLYLIYVYSSTCSLCLHYKLGRSQPTIGRWLYSPPRTIVKPSYCCHFLKNPVAILIKLVHETFKIFIFIKFCF